MRVIILYHPKSEQEGMVLDYVRDYKIRHPDAEPKLVSLDTIEGAQMAKLYDAYRYPAVLVVSDDGRLLQLWQEEQLPMMQELDAYMHAH